MEQYEWADHSINTCCKCTAGFTQLLGSRPFIIPQCVRDAYDLRLSSIHNFQELSITLFREALRGNTDPSVLHWLINETPASLAVNYHRRLEDRHFTLPVFFRTDEAVPGKIVELQCPGSLWGELQLLYDYWKRLGSIRDCESPAIEFAQQLRAFLNGDPIVHHMLDNASNPAGMRYFIERTRPAVRYWSLDQGVRPDGCNFIRSHSFLGLCADNEFRSRLDRVGRDLSYDLPPLVLFDQKATLALPFWSTTRALFSDDIRDLIVFTAPLLPTGIEMPDNQCLSIQDFSNLPRSQRSFYLKYAGSNVAMNWGSKAVFRLSNMSSDSCLALLKRCLMNYEAGSIWLIQKEVWRDDEVEFLERDGTKRLESLRAKYSAFYGPAACLGILAMHRHHNKVHGQPDTVVSYVEAGCFSEKQT